MGVLYGNRVVILLFLLWKILAYPHERLGSLSIAQPTPRSSFPTRQGLATQNVTSAVFSPSRPTLHCYEARPGRPRTSIDGCRPTLNQIKTFPEYRRVQEFLEGWYPKFPQKPPYAVHHEDSDCAIKIASFRAKEPDLFSFEQVRILAQEILQDCEENGTGGIARIGRGVGWTVAVIGTEEPGQELSLLAANITKLTGDS